MLKIAINIMGLIKYKDVLEYIDICRSSPSHSYRPVTMMINLICWEEDVINKHTIQMHHHGGMKMYYTYGNKLSRIFLSYCILKCVRPTSRWSFSYYRDSPILIGKEDIVYIDDIPEYRYTETVHDLYSLTRSTPIEDMYIRFLHIYGLTDRNMDIRDRLSCLPISNEDVQKMSLLALEYRSIDIYKEILSIYPPHIWRSYEIHISTKWKSDICIICVT
jgi:hypothetical protein